MVLPVEQTTTTKNVIHLECSAKQKESNFEVSCWIECLLHTQCNLHQFRGENLLEPLLLNEQVYDFNRIIIENSDLKVRRIVFRFFY